MNQTKNKYESLLTLHYMLCRTEENELREIGQQISDVLQFVEKYKLFPVDLSEHFQKRLVLICEGNVSDELKLDISKELYIYLGKMMFSFEESTIIKMEPYARLLELNRTEFTYEQANDWGSEIEIGNILDKDSLFFTINRRHILLSSEDEYIAYYNELRKEPFDINGAFADECKLPSHLYSMVEDILRESYRKCSEYIDEHYSQVRRAFTTYNKDVHVYIQARYGNAYLVMMNMYEGVGSGITVYPNIVDIMYRFSNVEAIDESRTNCILTSINKSDYSSISSIFCIPDIHHELNRLFVRYASDKDLTDYLAYILRGRLRRVVIINEEEIEVNGDRYLLLFSQIPAIKEFAGLLNKGEEKTRFVAFRFRPDDNVIEFLKNEGVSYTDVMHLGLSLINNQNGEMIHWFIKDRLEMIQIDDTYKELSTGDSLIKRLRNCPKGAEGWKQYENIGGEIFHFLFENTFRNYTYEYQSTTSDGTQRRDLVVNNTFKDSSYFWQLAKSDYHSSIIVVDFKNYREAMNSDSFYIPTKYLNSTVGNFVIVFSRCGLDDTAKKVQQRLLAEKKLVLCLTDTDLISMINQKMNGQEPLSSLENMYYTMCKNQ